MILTDFDYQLDKKFIAQKPLKNRDQSKLMVIDRDSQSWTHHQLLDKNSVLVLNESRVIPARIEFKIKDKNVELLLIKPQSENIWECMVRPGQKFKIGNKIKVDDDLELEIKDINAHGLRIIQFQSKDFNAYLRKKGVTPLPPYIKEKIDDPEKYQTIYSKTEGSVAAPTAGFHFTKNLLKKLKEKGIQIEFVTLHVGLGTFQAVKIEDVKKHQMHSEYFELNKETANRLNKAKEEGKKIIAVGTTSVRVLESCSDKNKKLTAKKSETDIFIYPGYQWKFVDGLITNFHVPKSTLLMLVSSFSNRELILKAYEEAKKQKYRFFSFGDAMYIK